MNENINLVEILKGHEGETFYSPLFGEVILISASETGSDYPIIVRTCTGSREKFTSRGVFYISFEDGECLLFPDKDQRDWNKPLHDSENFQHFSNEIHTEGLKQIEKVSKLEFISDRELLEDIYSEIFSIKMSLITLKWKARYGINRK